MKALSKSKLLAYRQCHKRLWLEVYRPDLRVDSDQTQASFATGHSVGEIAQRLYDPDGKGAVLDIAKLGIPGLLAKTQELLSERRTIFEAGFSTNSSKGAALALADVLIPDPGSRATSWRMVEVKSSASVKDYHRDDVAIQHHVATTAGVSLSSVALAHIDSSWTYRGNRDYRGLLIENDLTEESVARSVEVQTWINEAHRIVQRPAPPVTPIGKHCNNPYECGFSSHCAAEDVQINGLVERPVSWLPRIQTRALKEHIESSNVRRLDDVPDWLLNETQLRVKRLTLSGKTYFDARGARRDLSKFKPPALFLDFETISFPVPLWAGTRPFQQVPFQFSIHGLDQRGQLHHGGYLDLSGDDPSLRLARALIQACGTTEPVFAYNAGFEGACLRGLAKRFPRLAPALLGIEARLVDLLPITRTRYYDPRQQGSWSIKAVLPTIDPALDYADLEGVQDGGGAQDAFLEAAVTPGTSEARKRELHDQLWRYCRLDTFAMVRLWGFLAGRASLVDGGDTAQSISFG